MVEKFKIAITLLVVGVLVGTGMRAAEWAIPAPQTRLLFCFANDLGKVEACKTFEEISEAKDRGDD